MPEINHPIRHVARVTVELDSPFLVGSGEYSPVYDVLPVLDANGLPVLPGTSLAGLLRHAVEQRDAEEARRVFGYSGSRDRDGGQGSRLWVSWGHIHDSKDVPVDGLRPEGIGDDPVLGQALSPVIRDHVRIGHTGAAEDRGKFDEAVVAAGHRFTFELQYEGEPEDKAETYTWLLRLLASNRLRIGRAGRRGLGRFRVVRLLANRFDLRKRAEASAYAALPAALDQSSASLESTAPEPLPPDGSWRSLTLELKPEAGWGVNGAEAWLTDAEAAQEAKLPDFNPVREMRIVWEQNRGRVEEPRLYVPGSSIKGALAHRVAFHFNALKERFADRVPDGINPQTWLDQCTGSDNEAVQELFGEVRHAGGGRPGRVYIDDVWLAEAHEATLHRIMHNSLDRFTGGTRSGVLFEERVLYRGSPLRVEIGLDGFGSVDASVCEAFRRAVADLLEGRLALGAGAGRGHGYFKGVRDISEVWSQAGMEGDA